MEVGSRFLTAIEIDSARVFGRARFMLLWYLILTVESSRNYAGIFWVHYHGSVVIRELPTQGVLPAY